jgi:hypothetical protein
MGWMHAVVDVPPDEHAVAAAFWGDVTRWRVGAPWSGHPELSSFEPPQGRAYLHLQRIDGPPRVHLDLESDDLDAAVSGAERDEPNHACGGWRRKETRWLRAPNPVAHDH